MPLYSRGDDANARQFPSLHAVQRHMADTGRFKMAWEDNEEEYADFYDFGRDMEEDGELSHHSSAESCQATCSAHIVTIKCQRSVELPQICKDPMKTW